MALKTKTMTGSGSRGYSARLTLTEDAIDVITNTSSISYKLEILSGNYSYSQYETGWSISINGVTVSSKSYSGNYTSLSANSSITLASGSTTVTHNNDGDKTVSISASVACALGSYGPGDMNLGSSDWVLTNIPRASSVSLPSGTLNTSLNITVTPYVSTYTHTLTYTCGSASGTIASNISGSTSGFTRAWTPPTSLAAQNTTGTTVSVTVTCETFKDGTSLGTKSATATMTIPASVKPSVTLTLSDPTGYLTTYGAYVQNKSTLKVVLNKTTSQGATIASYSIKVGTRLSYNTDGVTTGVLPESGTITVTATITDTRGRTGTVSSNITVVAYSAPSITDIGIFRSDSSGNALATGTYATVTFKATVSPMTVSSTNKNTAAYALQYKVSTASSYTTSTLSTYANNFNVTAGKATFSAAIANSYDARIRIIDAFGTIYSVVVRVQSSAAFFKMDPVNNGLTLGKLETKANTFINAWATELDGNLKLPNVANVEEDLLTNVIFHGTSSTAAATAAKVATVSGTFPSTLKVGTMVCISFDNTNSAAVADITLNVNSTGAKPIRYVNNASGPITLRSVGQLYAGMPALFIYNGTYWVLTGENYNNTYSSMTQAEIDAGTSTTGRLLTPAMLVSNFGVDRIVEVGTSGVYTYRKWSSGIAECWGTHSINMPANAWGSWGSDYDAKAISGFQYPSGLFIEPPVFTMTVSSGATGGWFYLFENTGTAAATPPVYFVRPSSINWAGSFSVNIMARGKWK